MWSVKQNTLFSMNIFIDHSEKKCNFNRMYQANNKTSSLTIRLDTPALLVIPAPDTQRDSSFAGVIIEITQTQLHVS
jgi:hypothetical protein